ncbi:MAG: glycoside hydrolase family 1 protein [Anaerolineae bacterium]
MPDATFHFPPDFQWGVATASHEVEGNNTNNQWWAWEHQPNRIAEGHTSGLACNWWENAEADFDRAAAMGLNTLRLSIEWSRVEVAPGRIDMAALDRYREMLESLRERDIQPMVTLHHFSNPLWVAEKGGWANRDIVPYFSRYVEQVVTALRDYVDLWCTINEPNVYASMGYVMGTFPPGVTDIKTAAVVLRHMLIAHAQAYRVIHRLQEDARVGLAHNLRFFDPANPKRPLDRIAAWANDVWFNQSTIRAVWDGWWLPPLGFGPSFTTRRTLDWVGLNYYTRDRVAFDREAKATAFTVRTQSEDAVLLDGGYGELYAEGIHRALRRLARLGIPIHITENGIPDRDDDQRPSALLLHLYHVWKAIQHNIPVRSYYHWTLTDNFEWAEGWTLPFGLIELQPETQRRTPRPSAELYGGIARGNALTPEMIRAYAPEVEPVLLPS